MMQGSTPYSSPSRRTDSTYPGFSGSSGFLVVSRDRAFIATDFRYFEQTARQCPDYTLIKMTGGKAPRLVP